MKQSLTEKDSEMEKDIWELENLEIPLRQNPIAKGRRLHFERIPQRKIRQEIKQAAFLLLRFHAVSYVDSSVRFASLFARYLEVYYPDIFSLTQVTRSVIEEYIIYLSTENAPGKSYRSSLSILKSILEEVGSITNTPVLFNLFLHADGSKGTGRLYRAYSDAELERLDACIMKMPPQYARAMMVHQLLGTRISDTLTLKQDCLINENGRIKVRIDQVKTSRSYEKAVNRMTADLIRASIRYTQERFGTLKYVFVNERLPDEPLKYRTVSYAFRKQVGKEQAVDDHGRPFEFRSHWFRHTYGQRLTEMGMDDAVIAKLLGHMTISSVWNYRRIGSRMMAEQTKEIRAWMDEILTEIIKEW